MNTKLIHTFVLLLLLSLTVHEVHASLMHDVETCDVCIQLSANGGAVVDKTAPYALLDVALHIKIKAQQTPLIYASEQAPECIRGPPVNS